jgi:hypothetical protein
MTDKNVERVAKLDTATLSDALDKLRIAGQCLGIKPRDQNFRLAGRAYTILYGPLDAEKPGTVGDFIDKLGPGTVVVIDNGGREDATVWGDIRDRRRLPRCASVPEPGLSDLLAQLFDANRQGPGAGGCRAGAGQHRRCARAAGRSAAR